MNLMTIDEVNQRLADRLAHGRENKFTEYVGPSGAMGLELGDVIRSGGDYEGWTRREIRATPFFIGAHFYRGREFAAQYLARYWARQWAGETDHDLERLITSLQLEEAGRERRLAEQDRQSAEQERQYVECFGPPIGYRAKDFANFEADTPSQKAALEIVQRFPFYNLEGDNPEICNLVLAGPTGTGKTHLAAAVFKGCRALGEGHEFITATSLMRKFRERGTKESVLLARYGDGQPNGGDLDEGCTTLILDDFGVEADAYAAQILCEILDRRMCADLQTAITTNSTETELREWLGERGFSRLMYRCKWVPVLGADHRMGVTQ